MKDVGQQDRRGRGAEARPALPPAVPGQDVRRQALGRAIPAARRRRRQHALDAFLEQIEIVHRLGIRIVLVHGGGPQTTALAERLGLATTKVDGRRVTDASTLEVAVMATTGTVNTTLLAACRRLGMPAVGVSGVDAGLIARAPSPAGRDRERRDGRLRLRRRRRRRRSEDARASPRRRLRAGRRAARRRRRGHDPERQRRHDRRRSSPRRSAPRSCCSRSASPGLLERADDPDSLVSLTDLAGLAELEAKGALSGGMLPKAKAIRRALDGGVPRVHLVPFAGRDALLAELFTNEGIGTMVVAAHAALEPEPELVS